MKPAGTDWKAAFPGDVEVKIIGAADIPNADLIGKSDPYVMVYLNGSGAPIFQTPVVKNNLNPSWNFVETVRDFGPDDTLLFKVMDKDTAGKDDVLVTAELTCAQIGAGGFNGALPLLPVEKSGKDDGKGKKKDKGKSPLLRLDARLVTWAAASAALNLGGSSDSSDPRDVNVTICGVRGLDPATSKLRLQCLCKISGDIKSILKTQPAADVRTAWWDEMGTLENVKTEDVIDFEVRRRDGSITEDPLAKISIPAKVAFAGVDGEIPMKLRGSSDCFLWIMTKAMDPK